MEEQKEFFTNLFDFSFSEFIVPQIIKILFGIGILASALTALWFIIIGFHGSAWVGILAIIFSPVIFVISVILVRVYLEVVMVLFRIADNITKMVQEKQE